MGWERGSVSGDAVMEEDEEVVRGGAEDAPDLERVWTMFE